MKKISLVLLTLVLPLLPLLAGGDVLPYLDETLTVEERVNDLLGRLTVEEKISLLRATSPGIPRLGIPKYYHGNEALHGIVRPGRFTVFPQAIGLSATWDPEFIRVVSSAISDEARARWNALERGEAQKDRFSDLLTFWSPTVNMARDPRWGRTPETYGEDPFLTSRIAVSFVMGLQGDDPRYLKAVSTPKHFAANNEEHNRFECNAIISERDLREYYLPAYEACVKEAGAQAIMSAYNAINGIPCTANPYLLTRILREEWGFDGYVVSDCGAPYQVVGAHKFVKLPMTSAALCLKAGLDLECGDNVFVEPLMEALRLGMVSEDDIDRAAFRVLRARMRLGLFDDPSHNPYNSLSPSLIGCEAHQRLALEAARKSLVLLKNDKGFLPLDGRKLRKIAVLGPNAAQCVFGDYSGTPVIEPVSVLEGIRRRLPARCKLVSADWKTDGDDPFAEALEAARGSDVVVAVMGSDLSVERETCDRTSICLSEVQQRFLRELYAVNRNVVLVLVAGSSLSLLWEDANLPAILDAWYPGESGGIAVAEALFGDFSPAGRLPLTFYRSMDDLPAFDDYDLSAGRTYQFFEGEPLYAFGHGLSYSSFKYTGLEISETGDYVKVAFSLKNTGRREADEVAQLYVRMPAADGVRQPLMQLKGFSRVSLKPGSARRVEIEVPRESLRRWENGAFVYPEGEYRFMIGASSRDIRLETDFTLGPR